MSISFRMLTRMNGNVHARKRLNYPLVALVTSLALLTSTAARAERLATGALFGGARQTNAHCYLYNVGAPIFIAFGVIRNQSGVIVSAFDGCTGRTLAQFSTCNIDANGPIGIQTFECDFQTNGTTADLRGLMDIRDGSGNVLATSNLR